MAKITKHAQAVYGWEVTVGTTATLLVPAGLKPILIEHLGGSPVYIGGAGVTVTTGWPLDPLRVNTDGVYGVVASGTATVDVHVAR